MKGQLSIDYYISLIVFVVFVTYLFFQLLRFTPLYLHEINSQRLRSEAYQISELLINDPGEPSNWHEANESDVKRIGLSDHSMNKTNTLSYPKIMSLSIYDCSEPAEYNKIRNWLGTEDEFSLLLINRVDDTTLLNCFPSQVKSGVIRVDVGRIVAIGQNSYGELTLQLW